MSKIIVCLFEALSGPLLPMLSIPALPTLNISMIPTLVVINKVFFSKRIYDAHINDIDSLTSDGRYSITQDGPPNYRSDKQLRDAVVGVIAKGIYAYKVYDDKIYI